MSFQVVPTEKGLIKAWINGVMLDENAKQQLVNTASMPFVYKHLAVMPDVHWGMGSTVGSVIPTVGAIIPAAVGVDIGCGMIAAPTTLSASDLPDNLKTIREEIEKAVPHGRTANGGPGDWGAWHDIPLHHETIFVKGGLYHDYLRLLDLAPKLKKANCLNHLGTLGTGNHFVELCIDENNEVWLMLHSGSRGIGNAIGSYFVELAKEDMRKWFINLPDENLAYFPEGTDHYQSYVFAVDWAQRFAMANRNLMLQNIIHRLVTRLVGSELPPFSLTAERTIVNCHHNYVEKEHHFGQNVFVTRKGAVRAREGDMGIIPGSMGVRSYIVRGKGNPESFNSCSHGAGRMMSRGQAKKLITVEQHRLATEGVECKKDASVLDESPAAYKPIDAVMAAQEDLVEIVHTLKQVVCVKG